jgi:hypothetical protein
MCHGHDHPENAVRVKDSRDDLHQFGQCGAHAPCQAEEFSGVVDSMDDGIPLDFDSIRDWDAAETRWIKINDVGHVWTIAARGLAPFPFRDGSAISASYVFVDPITAPAHSALELRIGGQLAFYYGFGGGVDDIDLPREVTLERGAASCASVDDCLTWSEYDLRISVNGSEPDMLRSGETKGASGYLVKTFRSAQATGDGRHHCTDAFVSDTTIYVAHISLLREEPDPKMDAGR